jgi:hypothetical protein
MTACSQAKRVALITFIVFAGGVGSSNGATYYLHREDSSVTFGAYTLTTASTDATALVRSSGNLKGFGPYSSSMGWWDTAGGVPGLAGVIPSGSTISYTLWMGHRLPLCHHEAE